MPADAFGRVAGNRHTGETWVPGCKWEACLDCDLAGALTPPHLLSSSVFPRDSCAPSVVHGRVVKMQLPRLSFFPPVLSSLLSLACSCPPPQIHPCSCLRPHITASLSRLHDSRIRSVHARASERACVPLNLRSSRDTLAF